MDWSALAAVSPVALAVLGFLLANARQNGRIEAGVAGLYRRIDRIERRLDHHRH